MEKESTVYILGAGFNQCVIDWDGLKPPWPTIFSKLYLEAINIRTRHIPD